MLLLTMPVLGMHKHCVGNGSTYRCIGGDVHVHVHMYICRYASALRPASVLLCAQGYQFVGGSLWWYVCSYSNCCTASRVTEQHSISSSTE